MDSSENDEPTQNPEERKADPENPGEAGEPVEASDEAQDQEAAMDEPYDSPVRVPQRDEGGPVPVSLEELQAAQQQASEASATIRDRHALKEYAAVYIYQGEATEFLGQPVEKGQRVDYRGYIHPEQLGTIKAAVEAGMLARGGR